MRTFIEETCSSQIGCNLLQYLMSVVENKMYFCPYEKCSTCDKLQRLLSADCLSVCLISNSHQTFSKCLWPQNLQY